jgi:hypothetical protein
MLANDYTAVFQTTGLKHAGPAGRQQQVDRIVKEQQPE